VAAPRLLAITPPHGDPDPDLPRVWLDAGAREIAVLLRRPGASVATQLGDAGLMRLAEAAATVGIPVLLSCDPAEADAGAVAVARRGLRGVMLRGEADAHAVAKVRAAVVDAWVGVSVHSPVPRAIEGADWVALAPIFTPRTAAPGKVPIGLSALRAWADAATPVLALGGIDARTAAAALAHGAFGLASIRSFFGSSPQVTDNVGAFMLARSRG
jgi:thiamine monophosphate synthase